MLRLMFQTRRPLATAEREPLPAGAASCAALARARSLRGAPASGPSVPPPAAPPALPVGFRVHHSPL